MMVDSQYLSADTLISLTPDFRRQAMTYCSFESCACRKMDAMPGADVLPPAAKHIIFCRHCGSQQRICELLVDSAGSIKCTHCGHYVCDAHEKVEVVRTVIEGMLCDDPALREVMPAHMFLGQHVQSPTNEMITHVFSSSQHQVDGNGDHSNCCDDAVPHFPPQPRAACDFCGMNHYADEPCVSPRGALPPGEKYVSVCKHCTTIYVTDREADDAAGGSVCPYCLTDLRERKGVRVPTLIHRLPHELRHPKPLILARNKWSDVVTFKNADEWNWGLV